jgi:hypothetical protein
MKSGGYWLSMILAISMSCFLAAAQQGATTLDAPQTVTKPSQLIGVTSSTKNPLQVALLRWYDANLTTAFTVGTSPRAVAFDGANIWVANFGSNNVTELRASDGTTLGTFAVGTNPIGVAFDGANIWVTNFGSNNVTKLGSDGTTLGSFGVGSNPDLVAFDGTNIWVTNFASNNVTKLNGSGTVLGTFAVGI